jgi:hypothetical protein
MNKKEIWGLTTQQTAVLNAGSAKLSSFLKYCRLKSVYVPTSHSVFERHVRFRSTSILILNSRPTYQVLLPTSHCRYSCRASICMTLVDTNGIFAALLTLQSQTFVIDP